MPEKNLIDIDAADEFHTVEARPTEWLKSLPVAEQRAKLQKYIRDLQGEYELAADATERSRIAILTRAAQDYLKDLQA